MLQNIDADCQRWLETGAVGSFSSYVGAAREIIGHGQISSSAANSYVNAAFQLYRNYDNAGATFGEVSLGADSSENATGPSPAPSTR